MNGLSVLIITHNEEENIRDCLESVRWAEEIVVVDAESRDRTVEIARRYTDKIWVRPWAGYAAAKNFALQQCTRPWVLWLDADERVPPELRLEILHTLEYPQHAGYEIPRLAYFLGRWIHHGGWYPGYVLRLFRRDAARFNENRVHEGVQLEGSVGRLRHHLLHYTDRTLEHYLKKFNQYTSLAAEELADRGKRFRLIDLLLRPPYMFLRMYLLRAGFRDGLQGFLLAGFSAAYVFAKYAKLWELQQNRRQASHKRSLVEKELFEPAETVSEPPE